MTHHTSLTLTLAEYIGPKDKFLSKHEKLGPSVLLGGVSELHGKLVLLTLKSGNQRGKLIQTLLAVVQSCTVPRSENEF